MQWSVLWSVPVSLPSVHAVETGFTLLLLRGTSPSWTQVCEQPVWAGLAITHTELAMALVTQSLITTEGRV